MKHYLELHPEIVEQLTNMGEILTNDEIDPLVSNDCEAEDTTDIDETSIPF